MLKYWLTKLDYDKDTNCFYERAGANTNWFMSDLKTLRGYEKRVQKVAWLKDEKYALLIINETIYYILVNGYKVDFDINLRFLPLWDYVNDKIKLVEVHYKYKLFNGGITDAK